MYCLFYAKRNIGICFNFTFHTPGVSCFNIPVDQVSGKPASIHNEQDTFRTVPGVSTCGIRKVCGELSWFCVTIRKDNIRTRRDKMIQCMDSENLHRRLKKIIGQVNAIDKMVDQDVPCEDILSQINAAKSALNKCGQIILEGHINHCVREAFEKGDETEIQNFTKAIERFANMQ